jgi:hypothetical protein
VECGVWSDLLFCRLAKVTSHRHCFFIIFIWEAAGRLDSFMIFLILSKCCFFSLKNGNAGKTATLYKCTAVYYMNE